MQRLSRFFAPILLAVVGCATSVPVECPQGFLVASDGLDCAPAVLNERPDGGNVDGGQKCDSLDCDDRNECTADGCTAEVCTNEPLEDGTTCTFQSSAGRCEAGECVVDCAIEDCRPVYACTEQGLRDAVRDGGDLLVGCIAPTTVTLTEGVLIMDKDTSLDGLGNLTVDADGQSRVFEVIAPAIVELVGTGMTGGVSPPTTNGGAITIQGGSELTTRNCDIFGNVGSNSCGGLGSSGTVTIIDSRVFGNLANARGGGLCNNEYMTLIDSTVSANQALEDGGGIYNTSNGVLTLERSTVSDNLATDNGGGIWTSGALVTLEHSSVTDNRARGAAGVRLWTSAEVRVTDSVVSGNVAAEGGGGFAAYEGRIRLERSILTNNVATGANGGGIDMEKSILDAVDTVFSHNLAEGGAAIYTRESTVRLLRTTVFANQASSVAGAIRAYGPTPALYDVTLVNCTLSDNSAAIKGGAIASRTSAKVLIAHSTLYDNIAPFASGLLAESAATFEVGFSAIHDGCAGSADAVFTSNGYNAALDVDTDACALGAASDRILSTGEMNLGELRTSAGLTPTHVPGSESLLVDAIPSDLCDGDIVEDQRGSLRGGGTPCDIGAVELQPSD